MRVVRDELEKLGYTVEEVTLGSAKITEEPGKEDMEKIKIVLEKEGFEILDRRNEQIIEEIKNLVVDAVHYNKGKEDGENYSEYISRNLKLDYKYLSNLFSSMEGITIEKFVILQKIEKVKELIVYDNYSLSEIAFEMDYSSTAHLSRQFKDVTGLTPSQFKSLTENNRNPIDRVT